MLRRGGQVKGVGRAQKYSCRKRTVDAGDAGQCLLRQRQPLECSGMIIGSELP